MNSSIFLGGEDRPVCFDVNFHQEFERVSGLSFLNQSDVSKLTTFFAIRAMAYAALKWGLYDGGVKEPNPKFSLPIVGRWLNDTPEAIPQIMASLKDAMPKIKNGSAVPAATSNGTI